MGTGLTIFLIWLAIAAIGIVASIKQRGRKMDSSLKQKAAAEEEQERRLRELRERQRKEPEMEPEMEPEIVPEELFEEGAPSTVPSPEPAPAQKEKPAAAKDFDPEEMIIYSEIMKPGYEKY